MAVIQAPQSGGGFNPLGLLGTLAMLVPGGQAIAPWLQAANAASSAFKGDYAGAIMNGTGAIGGFGAAGGKPNISFGEPDFGQMTRQGLSDLNVQSQAPAPDITANQRMLNGTESALPWSGADEGKYQGLLGQYGLGGKQAMGENADMGTRYIDNNMPQRNYDYDSLLSQYDLTDMDWTGRKKRRWI